MSFGVPVSYPPLANVSTADSYPATDSSGGAIRLCPGCVRVNIDVSNAAVYYELGTGPANNIVWAPERRLLPSFRSLERAFDAIRFRSAVAGTPAVIDVDVLTPSDIGAG